MAERLQKIIAAAGVASRRSAESLILAGRVRVNGQVAARLGTTADPAVDQITVDGQPVCRPVEPVYLLVHKPVGVLSTVHDPSGRPTVLELVQTPRPTGAPPNRRIYPVGRLDLASSGLLLLTDDGDLALRLTHPRYHLEKEYLVEVAGTPPDRVLQQVANGLVLDGRRTAPAEVRREATLADSTQLRIVLREGRKRQIRRVFAVLGHPVQVLHRVRIGPLNLGSLAPGDWRPVRPAELGRLYRAVGRPPVRSEHADHD